VQVHRVQVHRVQVHRVQVHRVQVRQQSSAGACSDWLLLALTQTCTPAGTRLVPTALTHSLSPTVNRSLAAAPAAGRRRGAGGDQRAN